MGCFLACFGYSKKRKRRKPSNKVPSGDQRHGSYQPLDSDVTIKLDITEKPIVSDSQFRDKKPKEQLGLRVKKKVSFNLNVKTYEPIPRDETTNYFSESDGEENCEKNEEETSLSKGDSTASRMGSYPLNYRYLNCSDSYDEEDGIKLEESDLDDDDNDEEEDDCDSDIGDDKKISQEGLSKKFCSLSMESEKRVTSTQLGEDKTNNLLAFPAPTDQELKKVESNQNARDRSQYVYSVLNPVENLTQWKAIKARAAPPLKHQRKGNIALAQEEQIPLSLKQIVNVSPFDYRLDFNQAKSLMQDIAVDASLSNWLVSSRRGTITKSSNVAVVSMSSKENMLNRSNS